MHKNVFIYLAAEVFSKILPFILIPYFTYKLGVDGFGELSLFQSIVNLLLIFITVGGDTLLTRMKFRYNECVMNEFALTIAKIYVLLFVIYFIVLYFIQEYMYMYSLCAAFSFSLFNILLIRKRMQERAASYLLLQLSYNILVLIFTVLFFEFIEASYELRALALIVSGFFVTLLFYTADKRLRFNRIRRMSIRKKIYWQQFFFNGYPLVFHKLSFFIRGQFDRFFVAATFSLGELGAYSAASQITMVIPVILTAINMAFVPILYKNLKSERVRTIKLIKRSIPFIFFICLMLYGISFLIPARIYVILLGSEFSEVYSYIPAFVLGFSLQAIYLLMSTSIIYFGKTKILAVCTITASLFHLASLYVLSQIDLVSVSYAIVVSNLLSIALVYCFIFNKLESRYEVAR